MGDLLHLNNITTQDSTADLALDKASKADLEHCVIIGWDNDGDFFFSSSYAAGPECLWLIELAKVKLLRVGEGD